MIYESQYKKGSVLAACEPAVLQLKTEHGESVVFRDHEGRFIFCSSLSP